MAYRHIDTNGANYGWHIDTDTNDMVLLDSAGNVRLRIEDATGNLTVSGTLGLSGALSFSSNPVISKDSGSGILIDTDSPDYGWADIEGLIRPDPSGANRPTLATYQGNVRDYAYAATDKTDMVFHIPHDYVPGTDLYLHLHWSHVGTAISGSLIVDYAVSYAKGHNQANFSTPVNPTQTISTPDIATVPQYRHRIDEFQLSASSPSASQIDTDDIEPDGIVLVNMTVDTIPTITGGSTNDPFIHTLDIHYQTTNLKGTKNKTPDFWT